MSLKKFLGEKSYFETEEGRKYELIKLPLVKLVLEKLPFLAPTTLLQGDVWEQIAVTIQAEFPEEDLNYGGFYFKEKYEQLDMGLLKKFRILFIGYDDDMSPKLRDPEAYCLQKLDEIEYYLYQIHKLKYHNIRFAAELAKSEFENRERKRFEQNKTLVVFEKDSQELQDEKTENIDQSVHPSVLYKKIAYLEKEISNRDQNISQLKTDNKKLQELVRMKLTK